MSARSGRQMRGMALVCAAAVMAMLCLGAAAATFRAGASRVDATLPNGVPLAGYNYAPRATEVYPLPWFTKYTTWMNGNVGSWAPIYCRGAVIDNGSRRLAFLTMDLIAADGTLAEVAYALAADQGFSVPFADVIFSASHSHSGPGALSEEFLWAVAPATDVMVPEIQRQYAASMAQALVEAEKDLQDAVLDVGTSMLTGVTHNRRSGISPYVTSGDIDPHLGVIAIDTPDGTPIATIWNYAFHSICYDAPNMKQSSDLAGSANTWLEKNVGGYALYINGDAGDINPIFSVCCQDGPHFSGGPIMGAAVRKLRETLQPTNAVDLNAATQKVDLGYAQLNLTFARADNCTSGGPLDVCSFCKVLDCTANIELNTAWIETSPRFTAFRIGVNGKQHVIVTVPGEALVEEGWYIRNDTLALGYDTTIIAGYSQNHIGYIATANEYDVGGYESMLTLFTIKEAEIVRTHVQSMAAMVAPLPPAQPDIVVQSV